MSRQQTIGRLQADQSTERRGVSCRTSSVRAQCAEHSYNTIKRNIIQYSPENANKEYIHNIKL